MLYVWHEDSAQSSTTQFWQFVLEKKLTQYEWNVTGYGSNRKLLNHVEETVFNEDDIYVILIDTVFDNQKVMDIVTDLYTVVKPYKNVYVAELTCFEYMMLHFKYFINWTKPVEQNETYTYLCKVRNSFIDAIDSTGYWITDDIVREFAMQSFHLPQIELKFISSEKIATRLLSSMLNTGKNKFLVTKTILGECWTTDCCNLNFKSAEIGNQKCNIFQEKITSDEKAEILYQYTLAEQIINEALKK